MARTTVEDCIRHCENHFELVLGVVSRSNELRKGASSDLRNEGDREIVHALREIASGHHRVDLEAEIRRNLASDEALTTNRAAEETPGDETDEPVAAAKSTDDATTS